MAKKPMDSATQANQRQELREIAISDPQAAVIRAVVAGASQKAAAAACGVSEYTVSRWANSDPAYIAALNLARLDAWEHHRAELAALLSMARETLRDLVDGIGGIDPAVRLKAAALILGEFAQAPTGPVTVEDATLQLQMRHKGRWQLEQDSTITMADMYAEALLNI